MSELKPCPFCGWIPVTERLPENQQRVIVQCKKCPMVMGWLMFGECDVRDNRLNPR